MRRIESEFSDDDLGRGKLYGLVPKPRSIEDWRDSSRRQALLAEHLKFREDALDWVLWGGRSAQKLINTFCSRDLLFYWNVWVWTYDPRSTASPAVPFVTWPYQDSAALEMDRLLGVDDCVIEKSRDQGASWLLLELFEWRWHFFGMQSFLLGSRKKDLVDKSANPDSLFWKIDFVHKWLPKWLTPRIDRTDMHIGNLTNGSTIDGESTTGDLGRAGRRTAIGLDEFAAVDHDDGYRVLSATQSVTRSRFFNSTPQGRGNAYADMAFKPGMKKIRMHWSLHPIQSQGLYTSEKDPASRIWRVKVLDLTYPFPEFYPYVLDGKLRSPWYDKECDRTPIPSQIAQELDIDYLGSMALFFDRDLIDRLLLETVCDPYVVGELDYDTQTLDGGAFVEREYGRIKLWAYPTGRGHLGNDHEHVVACDIGVGTGASYSTMSVVDKSTGEKIAEIADNRMRPEEWAAFAVAVAKWANNAKLAWEANGPGRSFGAAVGDYRYAKVYYRESESSIIRTVSDIPGWMSTKENKKLLLSEYHTALARRNFVNRSRAALLEAIEYVHERGGVEHQKALHAADQAVSGDNHGDIVIADALAWRCIRDNVRETPEQDSARIPIGSYAWRREEARRVLQEEQVW